MTTTGGSDEVSGDRIKKKMKFKTLFHREGPYYVCVYTASGVICSEGFYAESDYRPKLKLKDQTVEMVSWIF